jgi:integrase
MTRRRYFGSVRRLPSGRWQARYTGPDGRTYRGPVTFDTKQDADAWLSTVHAKILHDAWLPPSAPAPRQVTLHAYATAWLASRDLQQTTRDHYAQLLRDHIYPTFGNAPVQSISPTAVREWHAVLKQDTGPTARAHAYGLLRTILNTAVADDLIAANPCRVRGAGQSRRAKKIRPASLDELEAIAAAMPDRYRLLVLLGAWCALRFGELAELRRKDLDLTNGVIHIRRGVVRTRGTRIVGDPKTASSKRDVNIPPHLMPICQTHLASHAQIGRDGLIFPARHGGHLAPATLYRVFYPARSAAGRPDLRWHDLRHTGATLAAATGATLAELMARLGHSTPGAALRYQHAAQDRDKVIAEALSQLADGTVTPIRKPRTG